MIHVAGHEVGIGPLRIQRCIFCGYALIDIDLRHVAVPASQAGEPFPMFACGSIVRCEGNSIVMIGELQEEFRTPDLPRDICIRERIPEMPKAPDVHKN